MTETRMYHFMTVNPIKSSSFFIWIILVLHAEQQIKCVSGVLYNKLTLIIFPMGWTSNIYECADEIVRWH